jgi:hypothetical protein
MLGKRNKCECGAPRSLPGKIFKLVAIVIITIIAIIVIIILIKPIAMKYITSKLAKIVWDQCRESVINYRHPVYYPSDLSNPKFELKLAHTLWDIGGAASDAHCRESVPIPKPFNRSIPLYGKVVNDIITGEQKNLKAGFIYWNNDLDYAMIVFSGTHYKEQWRNNMRMSQSPINFVDESLHNVVLSKRCRPDVKASLVHSGFYDDYVSIRNCIHNWLSKDGASFRRLIITGRSLGGAISSLCAYDLSYIKHLSIVHYTFASPRIGNSDFANRFNSRVPYSIRVCNTSDYVCDLPLTTFRSDMYQHTGKPSTTFAFTLNTGSLVNNHIDAYRDLEF